ncbi:SDR family oxidoreductase [Streptomyces sp. NBC_00454]|uniref:SDR family oxidoreductase n=1 Tax=Streptomyces sp. NBC_00454 TaxID=2975747 RepID=UPI003251B9E1
MDRLTGKTAVVTGSSRSIGRGIAEQLAADGALVGIHYSESQQAAAEAVDAIIDGGGRAFAFGAKLGTEGDTERFWNGFDEQRAKYDGSGDTGLDIIVNNVAVALRDEFENATRADFDEMVAVNVRAPFFIVQQGLGRLRDGGRVINISSAVTRLALTEVIAYGTTKGALDTFTLILSKVLAARNITVNSVAPGYIDTDSNASWLRFDEEAWRETAAKSAFGRVGTPQDIADVVSFLASDDSRWVTGQIIDASGGTRL